MDYAGFGDVKLCIIEKDISIQRKRFIDSNHSFKCSSVRLVQIFGFWNRKYKRNFGQELAYTAGDCIAYWD